LRDPPAPRVRLHRRDRDTTAHPAGVPVARGRQRHDRHSAVARIGVAAPGTQMILDPGERPADPECPACGTTLSYVDTEVSSGAFRTQAASMPQISIHYYD